MLSSLSIKCHTISATFFRFARRAGNSVSLADARCRRCGRQKPMTSSTTASGMQALTKGLIQSHRQPDLVACVPNTSATPDKAPPTSRPFKRSMCVTLERITMEHANNCVRKERRKACKTSRPFAYTFTLVKHHAACKHAKQQGFHQ